MDRGLDALVVHSRVAVVLNGKTRPIGISCIEDKIVQDVLREVLDAIYEPIFRECSYGFRPGRGAHDALRVLNGVLYPGKVTWLLEIDIVSCLERSKTLHLCC